MNSFREDLVARMATTETNNMSIKQLTAHVYKDLINTYDDLDNIDLLSKAKEMELDTVDFENELYNA